MSITTITYDYDYPGNFLASDWKLDPQERTAVGNPGTFSVGDIIATQHTIADVGAIRVDNLTLSTSSTAGVQTYNLFITDNDTAVKYYLQKNLEIPPGTHITLIDKSSPVWLNSSDMKLQHQIVGSVTIQLSYTIHRVV